MYLAIMISSVVDDCLLIWRAAWPDPIRLSAIDSPIINKRSIFFLLHILNVRSQEVWTLSRPCGSHWSWTLNSGYRLPDPHHLTQPPDAHQAILQRTTRLFYRDCIRLHFTNCLKTHSGMVRLVWFYLWATGFLIAAWNCERLVSFPLQKHVCFPGGHFHKL